MKKLSLLLSIIFIGQVDGQIINTIAGNGAAGFSGDGGQATAATFDETARLTLDAIGNLYISDANNNRVRMVNSSGIITTIAGNGAPSFSGDGGQAVAAGLNNPAGITFDAAGNLFIADGTNSRVRKVNTSGVISTVVGTGTFGFSGDGGLATAAELNSPDGIAFDAAGNLYIADLNNNRIRKVNTSGIISTIAGNGTAGFSGDGGLATTAELNLPIGITVDGAGNLYIVDYGSSRIRKVNTSGIISTVAGNGIQGNSGNGGPATNAELYWPIRVTFDVLGNMYIAEQGNNCIRKINTLGIISTIAGTNVGGFSGDGGAAISAQLNYPSDLTLDTGGNLYVADQNNNRVRKVNNVVDIEQLLVNNRQITYYPNPTSNQFSIETNTTEKLNLDLYDVNGRHVFNKTVNDKENIDVTTLDNGIYILTIKFADHVTNKKLVIVR